MKRILMLSVVLMVSLGLQAQEKIFVIDMIDLLRLHPNRERDSKLMEDTEKDYQAKLDKQRDRFDELRNNYESALREIRNPALNEKAKAEAEDKAIKLRDVLADADRDLRIETQKYQRELGDLDTRLLRQVTDEIRKVVTGMAEELKADIIMDSSTMAYANPRLDRTDEVLKRLGITDPQQARAREKEREQEREKERERRAKERARTTGE